MLKLNDKTKGAEVCLKWTAFRVLQDWMLFLGSI